MNADLNWVSEAVIGCVYRVGSALGSGFLESVYENAMVVELGDTDSVFERQKRLNVRYRDRTVVEFVADLLVEQSVIVEFKAVRALLPEHQAQLLNYLSASGLSLGLLINFGTSRVQVKRMVREFQA